MAHTFLLEEGRWKLEGHWLERSGQLFIVKGRTIVAWKDNWYTMVTQLTFPGEDRDEITFQYRGRLDEGESRYTFVLQHSELNRVEGEGWVTPRAILQRYVVLSDKQRRSGFETLNKLSDSKYCLSSGIMTGLSLSSAMDAILDLQYM